MDVAIIKKAPNFWSADLFSREDPDLNRADPKFSEIKKELHFCNSFFFLNVGKTGFEPATPWSQTRCATGLRYFPNYFLAASIFSIDRSKVYKQKKSFTLCGPWRLSAMRYRPALLPEYFLAVRAGFEPAVQFNPYGSLANYWFQPLIHLTFLTETFSLVLRGGKNKDLKINNPKNYGK